MCPDLPDYEKKIIIVTPVGDYPAIVQVDLRQILGTDFTAPTIAGCVPSSIENPAIAYDATNDWFKQFIENPAIAYDDVNDRFKIDIEAITAGVISTETDLAKVLGEALAHSNPVIVRLTSGTDFIDPTDVKDRAARLVGVVYGSLDKLQQQATTKELLVQISHQGTIKDPTAIRALTSSDVVTVVQGTPASLTATVTQAAKDRTISSVDATATPYQISLTANNGNSAAIVTPAGGKALRLKFISLEQSADVDIGYRFGAAGTIHYLRTTKGVYVSNLIGCNNQGAADAALFINTSGASNVKGYILVTEV